MKALQRGCEIYKLFSSCDIFPFKSVVGLFTRLIIIFFLLNKVQGQLVLLSINDTFRKYELVFILNCINIIGNIEQLFEQIYPSLILIRFCFMTGLFKFDCFMIKMIIFGNLEHMQTYFEITDVSKYRYLMESLNRKVTKFCHKRNMFFFYQKRNRSQPL